MGSRNMYLPGTCGLRWTNQLEKEFQTLKRDLSRVPVLTIPDSTTEFTLQADALERDVGAVFSQ